MTAPPSDLQRDPFAPKPTNSNRAAQDANPAQTVTEIDPDADAIDAGKPPRNLKTYLVVTVAIGLIAFMLFPQGGGKVEKVNTEAEKAAKAEAAQPAVPGSGISERLKAAAQTAQPATSTATTPIPTPINTTGAPGVIERAIEGGTADGQRMTAEEKAAARRESVIASTMEASDVQLGSEFGQPLEQTSGRRRTAGTTDDISRLLQSGERMQADATAQQAALLNAVAQGNQPQRQEAQRSSDEQFLDRFRQPGRNSGDMGVGRPVAPRSGRAVVYEGTIVRTVLERGINTDLPGTVRARVVSDVYDSVTGRTLVIPKGSLVLGEYQSDFAIGQTRVLVALTRMILPDGRSVSLLGAPASDQQGMSGLPASVDNHFWRSFGSTFLVGAASLLLPRQNQQVTINVGGLGGQQQTFGSVTGIALQQVLQSLARRNQNIKPTGTIEAGEMFTFEFRRDMNFDLQ
jgi:type IV secretion system protein VirB10